MDSAIQGYADRLRKEHENLTYVARLSAGLYRWPKNRKLPSIDELLAPAGKQHPGVSPQVLLRRLSKIKGAEVKKVYRHRRAPRTEIGDMANRKSRG